MGGCVGGGVLFNFGEKMKLRTYRVLFVEMSVNWVRKGDCAFDKSRSHLTLRDGHRHYYCRFVGCFETS